MTGRGKRSCAKPSPARRRAANGGAGRRRCCRKRYDAAVRNRNECHLISTDVVRRFGRIAIEKLEIRNMTWIPADTVEEPGHNVAA
ncbi:MAG: hypothetical protein F4X66_17095 [Chloroflexi bacterium]|nr:hypothetical protein [Chloroflexota bacterium]MYE41623.1 hypothetical protein [Chloroflexota bacterium]